MFTATNSTKSPTSCFTCMPNTFTPPPYSNEYVMSVSTDSLVVCLKDLKSLTGLLPRSNMAGNSTPTPDRPGKTQWMTSTQNGPLCNSPVSAKNPTFCSGSVLNNSVRVSLQGCSTTKFLLPLDGDTVDTC